MQIAALIVVQDDETPHSLSWQLSRTEISTWPQRTVSLLVQECAKCFLWMVNKGAFLTNSERVRRHIASDESCTSCPQAKRVWMGLLPSAHRAEFFSMNLESLEVAQSVEL